ncbi:MAG: hypothetical protein SO128_04635 [Clostridium cadaveris]|uniref:Uncharacterized protein n=1 Tax=Clostridium cadaveris TaxID=1529 RepID=A0A1I2KCG5_9CLOT|nr:hypothetical protein [Clostridium cadaveris]MDM8310572.1 hypothetical protein [Clostridium cadaveris]MDY4948640.1 hypothetical protein [Clostridium cadaveris]NWK11419.1 hypothetical protein [Clostridium cadaveris]UFH65778.1 hypothetical protein KQH81_04375 [Clostridium cadaveris]SFF64742.1 hypothetical protein SAMN04487885_10589 [Clostridium cadaveris]
MIIIYPKYFEMPVVMDDDFEQFTNEKIMYRGEEIISDDINKKNIQEDEFEEIDEEYIKSQMQDREYYL